VLLWHDSWTQQLLKEQWPLLFSFAKQQQINTRQAWEIPDKAELFHPPFICGSLYWISGFQLLPTTVTLQGQLDPWMVFDSNTKFNVSKA
jgi:hypothetical protein